MAGLQALLTAVEATYEASELERERLEAVQRELRQTEKLRAVGQLAFGIAHEINTPIQFAGDSVHFLRGAFREMVELTQRAQDLCHAVEAGGDPRSALAAYKAAVADADPDYLLDELPKAFEQTVEGLKRVAQIVMAMKEFGRPDQSEKVLADINRCVNSTLTVAHNELKYTADVQVEFGELCPVPCYPGQLSQVVLNLLVNAAHAIAERYGSSGRGRILVRTAQESDGVLISISDNGCGIAEAHQTRIFEPFFTTKELGRGTGQGLSISRAIVVEKHGGSLTFESRAGVGTTFHLRLPMAEAPGAFGPRREATAHG
ncbi:MAG TPA: ATP-binding protein [Polyangiaceae bacterium]|nr:ATP-binding protein [Polyangiaceae bacterium]